MMVSPMRGTTNRVMLFSTQYFRIIFRSWLWMPLKKTVVDAVQHGKILDALPRRSCGDHFVLGIKTVLANQLLHTSSGIINNSCGLRREGFKVGVVSVISPNRGHNNLPHKGCHARENVGQVLGQ